MTSGLSLAADIAGLIIPVATGGGLLVRGLAHADDVVRAAAHVDDVAKAATHADDVAEAAARVDDVTAVAKRNPLDIPCSFDADTPVLTPAGLTAIQTLQSGDQVYAYDEATGTTGVYTITGRAAHLDPAVVTLSIADETIDTTPEHPFYATGRGWVEAGQLAVGDHLRRIDGSYGKVVAVRLVVRPEVMYNLTVAGAHTFFVGGEGWLVHNCPVGRTPGPTIDRATGEEVGRFIVDPKGNTMIETQRWQYCLCW